MEDTVFVPNAESSASLESMEVNSSNCSEESQRQENGKTTIVHLKTNTSLLDSMFDGYKLSLDALPIKELQLTVPALDCHASTDQYSLPHMKIFAQWNPLFRDPFLSSAEKEVFATILSDGHIIISIFDINTRLWCSSTPVHHLENLSSLEKDNMPPTIEFISKDLLVLCTGRISTTIYSTDLQRNNWKEIKSFQPSNDCVSHYMTECRLLGDTLHVIHQSVVGHEKIDDNDKIHFENKVYWTSLANENNEWNILSSQEITQLGNIEMLTLDEKAENLILLGSAKPFILRDSHGLRTEEPNNETNAPVAEVHKKSVYIWTDREGEIVISFLFFEKIVKSDVKFSITSETISLCVKDHMLLNGALGGKTKSDEAVWTIIDGDKLEIILSKAGDTLAPWNDLVNGDARGRYEEFEANDRKSRTDEALRLLMSKENRAIEIAPGINNEQLEDCDINEDDNISLYWLNSTSQRVTRECNISSHQLLFTTRPFGGESARVCLRYDVDGLLWSLDGPTHQSTFNAFGYVQAGKSQRRWSGSSPDNSYAVITELKNHAFIYWQKTGILTDMRNRKTNEQVTRVARQQVISLKKQRINEFDDSSPGDYSILGSYAANTALFLLTENILYSVVLR